MHNLSSFPTTGFLRLAQILAFIPVSKSTFYAKVAEGVYPKPVRLGPRTSAWRAKDIAALIQRIGAQAADNKAE